MRPKSVTYPGKLGQRWSVRDQDALEKKAFAGSDGDLIAALQDAIRRREDELLVDLLHHYGIQRIDKSGWISLARKLARAHVPAFQMAPRVGRPRKFYEGMSVGEFLGGAWSRRKRGRKREVTDARLRNLAIEVRDTRAKLRQQGRRATIKNALRELIVGNARNENLSAIQQIAKHLSYFQKQYSEAVKKFPELR